MTPAARERFHVRAPLLLISAAAWTELLADPGGLALHTHHTMPGMMPSAGSLAGWALMLAAMMSPALSPPVRHVFDRSFARRRARTIAIFVAGYGAIWMIAGVALLALARKIRLVVPDSTLTTVATVSFVALVWQFSPLKQSCLNRCHAHPELAAFGRAADIDALRFGLTHGIWCVGSCWCLMLLPLLVSRGHLAAMVAVSLWQFGERIEKPTPPRWRMRGPSKAARIAGAQARLGMQLRTSARAI